MSKYIAGAILGLGLVAGANAQTIDATWKPIAAGVFEKTDGDVTTRMAFGSEGAAFDRARLESELRNLENLKANGFASRAQLADISRLEDALSGIPILPKSGATIFATNTGTLCGRFYYGLDSHMVVGAAGAAVVARAGAQEDGFGPPPPFTYIRRYASATITPAFGVPPAVTVTNNTTANDVTSFANWQRAIFSPTVIASNQCTGSSYTYVQIGSTACSPNPGFISQTKSYATCVGSL